MARSPRHDVVATGRGRRTGGDLPRRTRRLPGLPGLRVLVVDPHGEALGAALRGTGAETEVHGRGSDALVAFGRLSPHVVVVAPEVESMPAAEVVRAVRRPGPVLVLLGVGPGDSEAAGAVLVAGATMAVARPYDPDEVARRIAAELPQLASDTPVRFGPILLDPRAHTVHSDGVEVTGLPRKEFALLHLLMTRAEQLVAPDRIKATLWAGTASTPSDNAVSVHVTRLRARLPAGVVLRTVRGLGYRLTLDGPA